MLELMRRFRTRLPDWMQDWLGSMVFKHPSVYMVRLIARTQLEAARMALEHNQLQIEQQRARGLPVMRLVSKAGGTLTYPEAAHQVKQPD